MSELHLNKKILQLALPNIITNITVPLLGMVDTAIVGHLGETHLGAIAIGTAIFNLIYWNFGFLRMGTSGFTAQAYGARRFDEAVRIFIRAFTIAILIALALLLLQYPIALLSRLIFNGSPTVLSMALSYFFVRIRAAPATLGLYAVKGWFIGMQNSRLPMWMAIFINVVNILCVLFINLITQIGLNVILAFCVHGSGSGGFFFYGTYLILELIVFFVEWIYYLGRLPETDPDHPGKFRVFAYALLANALSFGAGILLNIVWPMAF